MKTQVLRRTLLQLIMLRKKIVEETPEIQEKTIVQPGQKVKITTPQGDIIVSFIR